MHSFRWLALARALRRACTRARASGAACGSCGVLAGVWLLLLLWLLQLLEGAGMLRVARGGALRVCGGRLRRQLLMMMVRVVLKYGPGVRGDTVPLSGMRGVRGRRRILHERHSLDGRDCPHRPHRALQHVVRGLHCLRLRLHELVRVR